MLKKNYYAFVTNLGLVFFKVILKLLFTLSGISRGSLTKNNKIFETKLEIKALLDSFTKENQILLL